MKNPAPDASALISIIRPDAMGAVSQVRTGPWSALVDVLRTPADASIAKADLHLWSPATYVDGRRASDAVELVYALGLDIDEAPIPDADAIRAALAGVRAVVHSTSSATATAPRWRGVLALSRPVTAAEYRRLWSAVTAALPFPVGQAAKDPSRAWYVPRRGTDGYYECFEIVDGEPLDVDALLADADAPPTTTAPTATAPAATAPARADRRGAAARLLGDAWPATGRHVAQMALAGALRRDGWSRESALEILCDVCRIAGDEDRAKRMQTIDHTWSTSAPLTGWTRLGDYVDRAVIDAARPLLDPDADAKAEIMRMLDARPAPSVDVDDDADELEMSWGGWDAPDEPVEWLVQGLIPIETVGLFVARGSSCKTWAALDIARAVVTGSPWLGRYPVIQGGALVIDFESGGHELRTRIRLLQGGAVMPLPELGMMSYPSDRIDDPELWLRITRVARRRGIRLIVIDSLAAGAPGGDENDARAAMPLHLAGRCALASRATVLAIAHARKGEGGDDRDMIRGSSALYAACDWAYTFDSRGETDTYRRVHLRCIKPCAGFRPLPVGLELSKAGRLSWYEDEVASAGRNAETPRDVRAAVLLAIAEGQYTSVEDIRSAIGGAKQQVRSAIRALEESGEVTRVDRQYILDSDTKREARVLACLATGERFATAAKLAKAACSTLKLVESMERRGLICQSAEGRILAVPPS